MSLRTLLRGMREATLRRGGLFFVVVWGVLFFGGLTFVTDICYKQLISHRTLDATTIAGIAMEKLIAGIVWGSTMWFIFGRGAQRENIRSKDEKEN